jgi:PAS domain S-box-containing protein
MEMLAVVPHDPERLTRNTIRMKDFWSTGRLTGEDQHRCKDGTVIDIEYALAGVTIDGRDLMLGIDRDITARKRMEQALSESEERFRSLVSNIPGAIYRCVNDENWTMVFISSRIEELSGYPAADFIGNARRTYASIIYPEDQEFVATNVTQALEEQRPYRLEYRVAHADGTIRWVYEEGRGVFSTDGRLLWMDGVVLDNTARKQAEVALQESEARYRAMLDAIPDLMFRFTRDGTFLDYKAPAEMIPVSPPEALLGMRIEDVVPAEVNRQIMAASAQVLETGALQVLEYKLRIAETDRDFDARLVQYKTDQIFMIVRDVTERAHLEENLRLAKEDAERANAAKSEFLSRMSHELRTPLNAILGFAQLLELEVLSPDERESVEHILKAGQHLLQLINEVLEISRIETGNLSLSIEPVDIQEVLRETLDLVHPLAARVQVKLPSSLSTSYTSYVQADRQRLKQVLLNLLSNAVKYNRQFGTVDVECRTTIDDRLRILITDTGHGITTDQMDRLFTPFERLGAAQGEVEGSGLGLALSRRLIEVMGGTIGVKSIPGDGSTFWIELPHATAPVDRLAPAEATPYDSPRELGPRATILYIEDNLANLQLIERLLTMRTEIHLLPAMQGRLGLDLAREHRPDVILLDLHLPDLPGWEVLAQLQADARTRDIPVLVISADATSRQIEHLREAGAYDYITKPLDVHHFLAVLDEILRKTAGERGHQAGLSPDAP